MRRITTGIVGGPILGQLTAFENTVSGVVANQNIALTPSGTGEVLINSHIQIRDNETLKLTDSDSSHFVGLKSPATVTSDITYTLPGSGVTDGYVLKTDGSGVLSWTSPALAITDQTSDSATYYPVILNATTGETTTLNTSSSRMSFQPNTGNFTVSGTVTGTSFNGPSSSVALTADNSSNATRYPLFSSSATGNVSPRTDTGFTYNPSTGELTAVIVTASSDVSEKKDIQTITDAIGKIMNLRGVSYLRKQNDSEEIGVIAQEVEKVLPSLVRGEEGNKSVAYGNIVAVLIEAVKEQQNQIEELTRRLA